MPPARLALVALSCPVPEVFVSVPPLRLIVPVPVVTLTLLFPAIVRPLPEPTLAVLNVTGLLAFAEEELVRVRVVLPVVDRLVKDAAPVPLMVNPLFPVPLVEAAKLPPVNVPAPTVKLPVPLAGFIVIAPVTMGAVPVALKDGLAPVI